MKTSQIACLLALIGPGGAMAAPPAPQKGDHRPPPVPPVFAVLDTDHDRALSEAEVKAAPEVLAKLDKNKDGQITLDELHVPRPDKEDGDAETGRPPVRFPVPPVIATLDTDHDGTISAKELENAPDSLKELDKNGDGELSPEELRPQGPPPGGRPDRPGRPGGGRPQGPPPTEEDGETGGVE